MKPLALSTMYAQQERFEDGAAFARFVAESGYDAIEVSHSTPARKFRQMVDAGILSGHIRPPARTLGAAQRRPGQLPLQPRFTR